MLGRSLERLPNGCRPVALDLQALLGGSGAAFGCFHVCTISRQRHSRQVDKAQWEKYPIPLPIKIEPLTLRLRMSRLGQDNQEHPGESRLGGLYGRLFR